MLHVQAASNVVDEFPGNWFCWEFLQTHPRANMVGLNQATHLS
jgi:hypothetical protein